MNKKLTESKVIDVRACARAGMVIDEIAAKFGTKVKAIRNILQGKSWKHVHDPAGAGPVPYTTRNPIGHRRPRCPSCKGFIEADRNISRGLFLQCEGCGRTWTAQVTPEERASARVSIPQGVEQSRSPHPTKVVRSAA
jgi:hypothetical protein